MAGFSNENLDRLTDIEVFEYFIIVDEIRRKEHESMNGGKKVG